MNLLTLLWWSSLVFGLAALVWMGILIGLRLVRERSESQRATDQARVRALFLSIMAGDDTAEIGLRPYARRARLMAETLLEILALVRGDEKDRLLVRLTGIGTPETLRRRLERGSRAGRLAAAEALAAFPAPATTDALRAALVRSQDVEFKIAIWTSLIESEVAPPLGEMLLEISRQSPRDVLLFEPVVRRAATASPASAVEIFAQSGVPPATRALLADALGAARDYQALDVLLEGARAPDIEVRIASVRALGLLGHPLAGQAVVAALADDVWEVRAAACEAAGRIGLIEAAPALTVALGDEAWWVRFRAGEALANFGERGRAALIVATTAGQDTIRRAASLALAERGLAETMA